MSTRDALPSQGRRGPDPSLPFFAYGLFKPGEIAFFQIKDFVQAVVPISVPGALLIRDGVVVLDGTRTKEVASGVRVEFRDGATAYDAIQQMEPATQYKWTRADDMNVLAAVKPAYRDAFDVS